MDTTITKTRTPQNVRLDTLPRFFGGYARLFEQQVFDYMETFCSNYRGGYWEFYTLSNGGFFMAYEGASHFEVSYPPNHFQATLSAEATSLGVNLFAQNALAWRTGEAFILHESGPVVVCPEQKRKLLELW
jgi:hypothetical protein